MWIDKATSQILHFWIGKQQLNTYVFAGINKLCLNPVRAPFKWFCIMHRQTQKVLYVSLQKQTHNSFRIYIVKQKLNNYDFCLDGQTISQFCPRAIQIMSMHEPTPRFTTILSAVRQPNDLFAWIHSKQVFNMNCQHTTSQFLPFCICENKSWKIASASSSPDSVSPKKKNNK